ncbi:uncharacterized protein JCM10292_002458 [Rhodotorula paludigena]|uniref:uncharacterized protein n=1 Tax=Rhodotorula paludigena TaxID=86838 RepID=UPI003171F0CD
MASADVKGALAPASFVGPSRPAPFPSNSHLRGADSYDVWAIPMRALVGAPAYRRSKGRRLAQSPAAAAFAASPPPAAPAAGLALLASLADILSSDDGVEGWLGTFRSSPPGAPSLFTLESGATHFMCGNARFILLSHGVRAYARGDALQVTGLGSLHLQFNNGARSNLKRALLLPGISATLVSAPQLFDNHGIAAIFGKSARLVRDNKVIATGSRTTSGLYTLDGTLTPPAAADVLAAFQRFKARAELECGKPVKRLRSDNGGEYTSTALVDYAAEHGIAHKPTRPYSPQTNGVAERAAPPSKATSSRSPAGPPPTSGGTALIFTSSSITRDAPPAPLAPGPSTPHRPAQPCASAPSPPAPLRYRNVDVRKPTYVRKLAQSPSPVPAAALPLPTPNPHDFLSDPFSEDVAALTAAAGESLAASDEAFSLPSSDPRNHCEAACDVDAASWCQGKYDKFTLLRDEYGVYHVDRALLPPGVKLLGCRFIYRRKKDQHGKVTGHKFTSIRTLLALAARGNFLVHQADIDKAYIHGELNKELYMRVPDGVNNLSLAGKVLKLDCALYGLKQAGRVWNHRIHALLEQLGYARTRSNACIFVRRKAGNITILRSEYGIKDLGEAEYILGIQVHRRADRSIFLSQPAYLENALARLGQAGCCVTPTLMIPNQQLCPAANNYHSPPDLRRRYLQAVSSLMYAMLGTCPNLAHVVGMLSCYSARLDQHHWAAVYVPDNLPLSGFKAYSDFQLGRGPVYVALEDGFGLPPLVWRRLLVLPPPDACCRVIHLSLSHGGQEAVFLSQLFGKLGNAATAPTRLLSNNQGANALARKIQFRNRNCHLRLTKHFVQEMVNNGILEVTFIPSSSMVANAMTKLLLLPAFSTHCFAMGVQPLQARGGVLLPLRRRSLKTALQSSTTIPCADGATVFAW